MTMLDSRPDLRRFGKATRGPILPRRWNYPAKPLHAKQTLINHVVLVLDGSVSMSRRRQATIDAMNGVVRDLKDASERLGQETRITVYVFGDEIHCRIFDMDVFRLPDLAEIYEIEGSTALIAAYLKSQDELAETAQRYGDHAFLTFVATDGQENRSLPNFGVTTEHLQASLAEQPENWSTGWLVPDVNSGLVLQRLGVPEGAVQTWDVDSRAGILKMGSDVTRATTSFMENRASGVRGTRSVFDTSAANVNAASVQANVSKGDLTVLARGTYFRLQNDSERKRADQVVTQAGHAYRNGVLYYHHVKTENIQPQKRLIVVEKATGNAYGDDTTEVVTIGGNAQTIGSPKIRAWLGLPAAHVKVPPNFNPDFEIYVQSTAGNRNIIPNQHVVIVP